MIKLKDLLIEGLDLKKLEAAIKDFQKKIAKQGRVTNARDEQHLEQLIKVYKQMGGKKIKEEKLTETKMVNVLTKNIGKKKMKELHQYLWNVLDLEINKDFRLSSNGKILGVNVSKINPKSIQNIKKRYGVDLSEGKLSEGGGVEKVYPYRDY